MIACGLSAIALSGCASVSPQEIGYLIGALAGGAVGSAPGAAAGALLGTAAGSLIAKPIEHAQEEKERQSLQQQLSGPPGSVAAATAQVPPMTTSATAQVDTSHPQRVWIDEQVISGRVMPGHFDARYTPARSRTSVVSAPAADAAADHTLQSSTEQPSVHE